MEDFANLSEVERHFDTTTATTQVTPASTRDNDSENGTDEAMQFVRDFCSQRGLPDEAGHTFVEHQCEALANEARNEFKRVRNANDDLLKMVSSKFGNGDHFESKFRTESTTTDIGLTGHSTTTAETQLTKAEERKQMQARKYKKRLRNNRRSAHAAKVYKEVLRRALSRELGELSRTNDNAGHVNIGQRISTEVQTSGTKVTVGPMVPLQTFRALQDENRRLRMLLFQHGICQPILTAPYAQAPSLLSVMSGASGGTIPRYHNVASLDNGLTWLHVPDSTDAPAGHMEHVNFSE